MTTNPALGEALRARVVIPRIGAVAAQLRRLPTVEAARVDEAARLVPAAAFFDVVIVGRHVSDRDVRRIVDRSVAFATGRRDPRPVSRVSRPTG